MVLLEAWRWALANPAEFLTALRQHLTMCAIALVLALAIGLPIAIAIRRRERLAERVISAVNALRTIPSLVILSLMLPLLGIGLWPAVVALTILALPPILVNAYAGLRGVDPDVLDAAKGIGMAEGQSLLRVQLPLAGHAIFAGVRTALVQVLAGATLAPFIGGGGLGDFITVGIGLMDIPRLLVGAVPIVVLALGGELAMSLAERRLFASESAT